MEMERLKQIGEYTLMEVLRVQYVFQGNSVVQILLFSAQKHFILVGFIYRQHSFSPVMPKQKVLNTGILLMVP